MSVSLGGAIWTSAPLDEAALASLASLPDPVARCMARRWGLDSPTRPQELTPTIEHLFDPWLMHDMDRAVDRLQRAARDGERVRIITDYDVDGTTSSLVLQAALKLVGPNIQLDYHIPDRFLEGYGFSVLAAERAAADGVGLIVTADIGVRDHAAVAAARNAGVDVLICDHHLPAGFDVPPDAIVLCPPKADCDYPNPDLAACGVSLKLAQALLDGRPNQDRVLRSLMKLSAIGTVADVVSLAGPENRAIVAIGVEELNKSRHSPGLSELLRVSGVEQGKVRASDFGWKIGPRINAAGRVADATHVVELLNSRDPKRAIELADALESLNKDRRRVQAELERAVAAQLGEEPGPFPVLAGPEEEGWHRGVVGIVAGRVKEQHNRPAAVGTLLDGQARFSVRSVPGVHAVHALDFANGPEHLMLKYGGHAAAAGFSVPLQHLETVRERLAAYAREHQGTDPAPPEHLYDAVVSADDLELDLADQLAELGPFGQGNPEPLLLVSNARCVDLRVVGRTKEHLQFKVLTTSGRRIKGIAFRRADWSDVFRAGPVDLLAKLTVDSYRGRQATLTVEDARPVTR